MVCSHYTTRPYDTIFSSKRNIHTSMISECGPKKVNNHLIAWHSSITKTKLWKNDYEPTFHAMKYWLSQMEWQLCSSPNRQCGSTVWPKKLWFLPFILLQDLFEDIPAKWSCSAEANKAEGAIYTALWIPRQPTLIGRVASDQAASPSAKWIFIILLTMNLRRDSSQVLRMGERKQR